MLGSTGNSNGTSSGQALQDRFSLTSSSLPSSPPLSSSSSPPLPPPPPPPPSLSSGAQTLFNVLNRLSALQSAQRFRQPLQPRSSKLQAEIERLAAQQQVQAAESSQKLREMQTDRDRVMQQCQLAEQRAKQSQELAGALERTLAQQRARFPGLVTAIRTLRENADHAKQTVTAFKASHLQSLHQLSQSCSGALEAVRHSSSTEIHNMRSAYLQLSEQVARLVSAAQDASDLNRDLGSKFLCFLCCFVVLLVVGCWLLVVGCCLFVFGCLLLVCWLLVCWFLVVGCC